MSDQPVFPPPPVPKVKKPKSRWIIRWVLGISLLLNLVTCSKMIGGGIHPSRETPMVSETLAWGEPASENKVVILQLKGAIMREEVGSLFGSGVDPVTKILSEIQAATVDEDVQAILLEVNSPGGGVTASDEIYEALLRFKSSKPDRKLVVYVKDMAASGGYYAALPADKIIVQPTSVVGSIGVIISSVNVHGLGEKMGVQDVTITSRENKALLNPLSPPNPEHNDILQGVVDDMYVRFRDLVLEHRPIDAAFAKDNNLFDGRIFTAADAVDMGLVDLVGYGDKARGTVLDLLGVEDAAFVEMKYTGGWSGLFGAEGPSVKLPFTLPGEAHFLYMWTP